MAAVLHARARRSNKGRFCSRAEAFIRNNNAANRLTASWSAIKKQEIEKNVRHPEVCSGVSLSGLRVVELNVLAEALNGGCEACGVALRLSDCIKETVSGWARITTLHMLFKLRVWRDKYLSNKQDPPVSLLVEFATFEFATCSLLHNRVRYQILTLLTSKKIQMAMTGIL